MSMKLNISYPQHGSQKLIELDDEKKTRLFYDRRIAEEVPADALGDEWKGYVLKITGGNDKQGFAMKQGVLLNHRTRLLLDGTSTGFHPWKRPGHRKRKSVRGCIIGPDIAVINSIIIKKGDQDLPGLTNLDSVKPSLRGPKRANNIRKLWGLTKADDVRQFVSRKKIKDDKKGKPRFKSPKIQRLISPIMLHRKKRRLHLKVQRRDKAKKEASEYAQLLANIRREKRKTLIEKRRAQSERKSERLSERKSERAGGEKEKTTKQQKSKEKAEKAKPEKTKKTKKDQTSEQKTKKQKKDTEETSEGSKSKGGKAKQPPKKDQPATAPAKGKQPAEKTSSQKGAPATGKAAPEKSAEKSSEKPAPKQEGGAKAKVAPAQQPKAGAGEKAAPQKAAGGEKAAPQKQPAAGGEKAAPQKQPPAEKQPAPKQQGQAKQPPQEKRAPEGGEKGPNKKSKKT